jgi:Cft2 family RNA processing exonuclease
LKIRVLGAAREVGGSCISVETENCKVALDYGIKLDEVTDEYPKSFDAIIISHAHLDHSGSLPRLSKTRRSQYIVGSKATRDISADLLKDMIKVQTSTGGTEIYDTQVINKIVDSWHIGDNFSLPGMQVELYSAGHVAGARMVGLRSEGKEILYTGDFCVHDTEIIDGCRVDLLPKEPDVLIMESTYGGKIRPPRTEMVDQLLTALNSTIKKRGNILIPTFAFHRSQEMAKRIDLAMQQGKLPKYNVYTVSSLAQRITHHFNANPKLFNERIQQEEKPFEYKYVKHVEKTTEIDEPAIAICTPGFGHAGASLALLQQWAEGEDNLIMLTSGYFPADSPLKIAKEKHYFREESEKIPIRAEIKQIELSGHADQNELVETVKQLKPKRTILVHGDLDQAEALSEKISDLTDVYIPEKAENITI